MGILAFIILGACAGAIAQLIIPGRVRSGFLPNLVVGMIGAIVGGWLGTRLFDIGLGSFFDLKTWLVAVGGSIVTLLIWGLLTGRNRR
ncbi:MAG: GlsB/YeaQ/YmgE family stress response membrane protein [Propionibacteriaceae bacterium]|jgi:uncharacterized membrane protein YeaQ/YmgE (transglycosylase-associated protein family)|nr:GlsB/YeaQ/YmgE family stress response membrane protein [Propionibacteriaceae bacterium]